MADSKRETIRSKIWREVAEPDNPFAAAECFCGGYDVYGDVLGQASWIEYLYLLFKAERPAAWQAKLLEGLAVAVANPGPRDQSVHAAMSGGVGGSTHASCLMAALAVGAGQFGGAHEVANCIDYWHTCEYDIEKWRARIQNPVHDERADIWLPIEHPPGFDPHGASCTTPVRQTLAYLAKCSEGRALRWLVDHREELELVADSPLWMPGVAAAAFVDLELTADQAEMLYLLLRLPGAAVHALEQQYYGYKRFPFFHDAIHLVNDPGPR